MRYVAVFLLLLTPLLAATHVSNGEESGAGSVQAIHDDAGTVNGDTITIPAGTYYWSSAVTITKNINLVGAGTAVIGGGDVTTIVDDYASGSPLLNFYGNRLSGITFEKGTGSAKSNDGVIMFGGSRIDHCTFVLLGTRYMTIKSKGVCDNNIFTMTNQEGAFMFRNATLGDDGDTEWANPTAFGSADYFYVEDNQFNNTGTGAVYSAGITDGDSGAKFVIRFNTGIAVNLSDAHATGHTASNNRGVRSREIYGNSVTSPLEYDPNYAAVNLISGTALVWGNSFDQVYKQVYAIIVNRLNDTTYAQSPTPGGWGYGGSPIGTGTVNTNEPTVTRVSGSNFDSGWAGRSIIINGATRTISTVDSASQITLAAATGSQSSVGTQSGVSFYVGSAWDGNTDSLGYPLLDQPGRGQGDLLTGSAPSKVNDTTGTIAWPNQALEPMYFWSNVGTYVSGWGNNYYSDSSGGLVVANRDYYPQVSGIQTNSTTPFNGTSGTGWGTLANRPTTATAGVAYWATDQGDWNQSTSNPEGVQMNGADGVLYVATATDTWTLYYEPYTYPHPLRGDSITGAPVFRRGGKGQINRR